MKTNYVPAMVMLSAGLVYCICNINKSLSMLEFTRQLLLVLVIFLFIGLVAKAVLDKMLKVMADKPKEEAPEPKQDEDDSSDEK